MPRPEAWSAHTALAEASGLCVCVGFPQSVYRSLDVPGLLNPAEGTVKKNYSVGRAWVRDTFVTSVC